LSSHLAEKLFTLFIYIGKKESLIEQNRQKLAHVSDFEPRQLFEKLAFDGKHLKADDIFRFTKLFPDS
jgi:DNA polymerase III delta subunit